MKSKRFLGLGLSLLFLLSTAPTFGTRYATIPFKVSGRVVDWHTKSAVQGVQFILFLNDASYADNHGWVPDAVDFPNFAKSDPNGYFDGRTRLYRSGPNIEITKLEIIAFKAGYRTERFSFENPEFSLAKDGLSGTIRVARIELFKNKN